MAKREIIPGVNDLQTTHPHLAAQWHPYMNGGLTPRDVHAGMHIKVWWFDHGHYWDSAISSRTQKNTRCGVCFGKAVNPGINDLATLNPGLALDWDYEANYPLIPEMVRGGTSNHKYHWTCRTCGYARELRLATRVLSPQCAACVGNAVQPGVNDLATTHPQLAAEWDYERNSDKTPQTIIAGHNAPVFWTSHGHYWPAQPNARSGRGDGCAVCANRYLNRGVNDLATTHPELALEWDYEKNYPLTPNDVISGNNAEFWWKSHGHSWPTSITNRKTGGGCQVCVGKYINVGINDLASQYPHLAAQWDYTRNGDLTPEMVSVGSKIAVYWTCPKNHSWPATPKDRTRGGRGTGCPECARTEFSSRGEQEIADFLTSLGLTVERNNRSLIGQELDIYIPEKRLAIEYNDLYWHSDQFIPDNRHATKTRAAQDAGVRLIHVWEDDWRDRRHIVENLLQNTTGLMDSRRVYARQTTVHTLTYSEAVKFLDQHHIQGGTSGSVYYCLKDSDAATVAVMVLTRAGGSKQGQWTLDRYATSCSVPGGHSKLLTHFQRHNDWSTILTFSDTAISDGSLYTTTNWDIDAVLDPDYKYVYKNNREHKFNFRLKRFRTDPVLTYVPNTPERELARLNGLYRVYDCGKVRYILRNE